MERGVWASLVRGGDVSTPCACDRTQDLGLRAQGLFLSIVLPQGIIQTSVWSSQCIGATHHGCVLLVMLYLALGLSDLAFLGVGLCVVGG